jgi:acetyl-CoA synthetase
VLKKEIYDTWFQTETAYNDLKQARPNRQARLMGKPVGSVEATIIEDDGTIQPQDKRGNLCLKPAGLRCSAPISTTVKPTKASSRTASIIRETLRTPTGKATTGSQAERRRDKHGGPPYQPFEIESALLEIAEIAESGVIGAPDDLLFEKVVAFVALKEHQEWTKDLELKIRIKVSNKVSTIATPQEIIVVDSVPKNKSGKIMRRVLKAIYKGEDPGDLSTMED